MPIGGAISAIAAKTEGDLAWNRTKRMMRKRHQWEVSDLRKAGLNPILSAGGAPSMGSASPAKLPDLQQTQGQLVQARQNVAARKNLKSQRSLMAGQEAKLVSDIEVNRANADKMRADTGLANAHAMNAGTTGMLLNYQIPGAALNASIAGSPSGQAAAKTKQWLPHLNTTVQAIGAVGLGRWLYNQKGGASKEAWQTKAPQRRHGGKLP